MSIYAISDLHLSFETEKPMNKFGDIWNEYEEKMKYNWNKVVQESDLVLIPGDVSWATYLSNFSQDLSYVDQLNGIKVISKGNHDYWWETLNKLNNFKNEKGFKTINFIHNSCYEYEDYVICATKGFDFNDTEKIVNRECERLKITLNEGKKTGKKIILMLHYSPFNKERQLYSGIKEIFDEYKPLYCIYGHLHSYAHRFAVCEEIDGVKYQLVSCDYLKFSPLKIV
jgi:predicted phosphohydrolase